MAARRWIDYRTTRQLSKLAIAESQPCADPSRALTQLETVLRAGGWEVQRKPQRLAADAAPLAGWGPCSCTPAWCC